MQCISCKIAKNKVHVVIADGCQAENTTIHSTTDTSLDIIISWPETNLAEVARIPCPCGSLTISGQFATRQCGGSFIMGAEWQAENINPCNLSENARQICQLTTVSSIIMY